MSAPLVECVPNFSEGRDLAKVDAIVAAIASAGVTVLDRESDSDHNRSVVTFAGVPARVAEAAFRGIAKAAELIDLREHRGVHPRLGAADVVPFVPVRGVTLADCVGLAERTAERVWQELGIPVYLYEAAARRPERARLENVRRGEFEGIREEIVANPDRLPEFGAAALHPSAGAVIIGARKFLIAYNINLNTDDVALARRIARQIRTSSGGFPCVKAMGVLLASRNLAQVSMNLTDFEVTPVHQVFEAVRDAAAAQGVTVASSEIIGLIPRAALEQTADRFLQIEGFHRGLVLENRLEDAAPHGLAAFLDELAGPLNAAAATGAMVAALAGDADARRFLAYAAEAFPAAAEDDEAALHQAARNAVEVVEVLHGLIGRLPAGEQRNLAEAARVSAVAALDASLVAMADRQVAAVIAARVSSL
jgi:glutamate formiminotransferase